MNNVWAFPDFPWPNIATSGENPPEDARSAPLHPGVSNQNQPESNTLGQQAGPSTAGQQAGSNNAGQQAGPTQSSSTAGTNSGDAPDADSEYPDPRNAKHRRKRSSKAAEINLVHNLIRKFLDEKDIIKSAQLSSEDKKKKYKKPLPTMPPDVDPLILEEYCERRHAGPNKDFMPIAWKESMDHAWNTKVIQILATEFKKKVKTCNYQKLQSLPANKDSDEDLVFEAIRKKLMGRQSKFRTIVRTTKESPNLTPAELEEFFARKDKEKMDSSRRAEWRKNLYIRRDEIIQEALDLSSTDTHLWHELRDFFALFDEHDMSSDETETEAQFGVNKTVRRVRKHWIHGDVSKIMNYIDQRYSHRTSNGQLKRGNVPHKRLWDSKSVNTTCRPKPRLPRNVYNHDAVLEEALNLLDPAEPIMLPSIPN